MSTNSLVSLISLIGLFALGSAGAAQAQDTPASDGHVTASESPEEPLQPPAELKVPRLSRDQLPDFRQHPEIAWFKFDDRIPHAFLFASRQAVPILFLLMLIGALSRLDEAALAVAFYLATVIVALLMTATGWFAEPNTTALLVMGALSLAYVAVEFCRKTRMVGPWVAAIAWGFFHGMLLAAPLGRVIGSPPDNRFEEEVRPFAVGVGIALAAAGGLSLLLRKPLGRARTASTIRFIASIAAVAVAALFALWPASKTLGSLAPAHLESTFLSLHTTFYRAFSLEDEAGVKSLMEKSLTGELFTQHFENMVETLRDPDGHRLVMERLMPCTIRIKDAAPGTFTVDYCWIVVGQTHSHGPRGQQGPPRRKTYKYRADYQVIHTDQGWRLAEEEYTLAEEHASPPDPPWWMRLWNEPMVIDFPPHVHPAIPPA